MRDIPARERETTLPKEGQIASSVSPGSAYRVAPVLSLRIFHGLDLER